MLKVALSLNNLISCAVTKIPGNLLDIISILRNSYAVFEFEENKSFGSEPIILKKFTIERNRIK